MDDLLKMGLLVIDILEKKTHLKRPQSKRKGSGHDGCQLLAIQMKRRCALVLIDIGRWQHQCLVTHQARVSSHRCFSFFLGCRSGQITLREGVGAFR